MFRDREDAGRRLGQRLAQFRGQDVVVVGLPRGGVPVAFEMARELGAPLDILVVRKLGVPFQPELAMGAIAEGDIRVVDDDVMRLADLSPEELAAVEARERAELIQRVRRLRAGRPRMSLAGRTVIVVDDGVATGSTASAACQVVRAAGAERVVLAVPVAPPDRIPLLRQVANDVVCLRTPDTFFAIGEHYVDFAQITDEAVAALLRRAGTDIRQDHVAPATTAATTAEGSPATEGFPAAEGLPTAEGSATGAGSPTGGIAPERVTEPAWRDVRFDLPYVPEGLAGRLARPEHARGVVVLAHAGAAGRFSARSRYICEVLGAAGLATLLADLLTQDEEVDRGGVYDVGLLAHRLMGVTGWLDREPGGPVGYFAEDTAGAAALWAAAEPEINIAAVVCQGGRPDLAASRLAEVRAPTLLIVGGHDDLVLELNNQAQALLRCESRLAVVPGASHLFSEPGALERAAELARDWFTGHLTLVGQHGSRR